MPVLQIDVETRLAIAQAIMESPETISIITLPSGVKLRLLNHFGHVALEVIAGEDLFGDVQVVTGPPVEVDA
ncbi:hypothetical protein [Pseudomonas sp. Irchel s3b6]|uniref:hypothetical protein n=1 Tax=Pseudomonas sp. Irchel s3b6 TaxID=2009078 RepID=UPI000BA4B0C9|nr:hypothetical protein [Pseudomonas sp. Irchel s3b6]